MDTTSPEFVLGKRIVNYLKNEALIGRIGKQKIQVIAKTLYIITLTKLEL